MDKIKYIKYKEKYLQLKNTPNDVNNINMVGGFPFGSTESKKQHGINGTGRILYVMALVTGETLDRFNERREAMGLDRKENLHLTLSTIYFNAPHKKYKDVIDPIIKSGEFNEKIKELYNEHIAGFELWSQQRDSEGNLMGGKWGIFKNNFVRIYDTQRSDFRNYKKFLSGVISFIYECVNEPLDYDDLEINYGTEDAPNMTKYRYFYTIGKDAKKNYLFALNFDHAIENWIPHVTLLDFKELLKSRLERYMQFYMSEFNIKTGKPRENTSLENIIQEFRQSWNGLRPISSLEFRRDVRQILVSSNEVVINKDTNKSYKYEKILNYIDL